MKKIKLIVAVLTAFTMMFVVTACGAAGEGAGTANPVHESDINEVADKTGIYMTTPVGATEIKFSYIEVTDEEPIAQVTFKYNGNEFCYRAQKNDYTNILDVTEGDADLADMIESLNDGTNIVASLSGMHYEWKASAFTEVKGKDGLVAFNNNKEGIIGWIDLDRSPSILYSISMTSGATQEILQNLATEIYSPM
ncbi:MAG: hypothetical protein KBS68_00370 [Clostridiales bacterium]|nr:hypothetical protein [Candidatus Crickella merdequi]